ncbi:hypothetical protein FBU30_002640 [Linnemannia zychae]|nr:hypothetical protein FBU30_002640 [Linnemannia zychae]
MKGLSIAFFATVIGASILLNNEANAAPITQILSSASSPSSHDNSNNRHREATAVDHIQINSRSRSALSSASSYRSRSRKHRNNHAISASYAHLRKPLTHQAEADSSVWIANNRRLDGHVVLDDDDDDAGNELLDTELDSDLRRPDEDDTIEGEVIEEEDLDDEAGDDDDEGIEGHLLQHTLRAANTALNAARARAEAAAIAAASKPFSWIREDDIQDRTQMSEESTTVKAETIKLESIKPVSRFGGREAVAEMAAHAGDV